jgi:hypothetical protein
MLVSESSAIHQLRRRSAQKPQLDWIADRMPLEHCAVLVFYNNTMLFEGHNYRHKSHKIMSFPFDKARKELTGNSLSRLLQQHNQDDNQPDGQSANKSEIDASTART